MPNTRCGKFLGKGGRFPHHPSFYFLIIILLWGNGALAVVPGQHAIASAHPLATAAGFEILDHGGNAFDAAIAVAATLAVVEPASSGLGGGGFFLLHRNNDGFQTMVDARERAPLAAQRDMYLDATGNVVPELSVNGPLAAGIPGLPSALVHLAEHYGQLPLARSLAPAIRAARDGFIVDEHYRKLATFRLEALRRDAGAAATFLAGNEVPAAGYRLKQTALATTLEALAAKGTAGFYEGAVAEQLVAGVRAQGGIWTLQDLRDYHVVERKPVTGEYRGIRITSTAPPSSGGVALVTMLNILAGYDLEHMPELTRTHLIVEAMRRAYRDRAIFLGDPDFVEVPVARLTHPFYAAGLRASINPERATPSAQLPGIELKQTGDNTTHFSILDAAGNRVAATLSINFPFGAAFVAPGTGVLLNDEMDDFSAKPGVPNLYGLIGSEANAIGPGKRPLSSMTPTFLESADKLAILGTPGGSRIITMVLLGSLEFAAGSNPEQWVSRGRFHHQYLPDQLQFEPDTFSPALQTGLQQLGHVLKPLNDRYGNMQAILWDKHAAQISAASDPRGGGLAEVRIPVTNPSPRLAPAAHFD